MKRDLVLSAAQGLKWPQIEVWAYSLAVSGFNGLGAVILYNEDQEIIDNLKKIGFTTFVMNREGSIYNKRFVDIGALIENSLDSVGRGVVPDIRDVYFQGNPFDWMDANQTKPIIASSESLAYKDEWWNYTNLVNAFPTFATRLKDSTIYNVGVLGGEAKHIADMCYLVTMLANSTKFHVADQAGYNVALGMEPIHSSVQFTPSEAGWACQIGTVADPNKITDFRAVLQEPEPLITDIDIRTAGNVKYSIVHQYDRNPRTTAIIRKQLQEALNVSAS